jgi:acyl-CoA thioester hydrolase
MNRVPRPLEVSTPLVIHTYDIDFAGIVSNIVYIRWLEDLRLMMLDAYMPLHEQMAKGHVPVLAETNIQYKRPLRMFDKPIAYMWVAGFGGVRWTLGAEFVLDGVVTTAATQTTVFVDSQTMRPVPPPEHLVARDHTEQAAYEQTPQPQ